MGIINSVNLAVSAMEDMNQAMNTGVDTASIAATRSEINQATIAAQQLSQAFENMESPATSSPHVPTPELVPQTVKWQSNNLEVFNNSGIERYQQEIRSVNAMLSTLNEHQIAIDNIASNMDILPDSAIQDITGIHDRIQEIILKIQEIESNPINMGTDRTNNELERLRSQLNRALSEQENLNQAVNDMDVAVANTAYMRLSQTISSTEQYIRDNVNEQGEFNRAVEECHPQATRVTGEFAGWQKAIIVVNNAIGLVKNTLGNLGVMDMSGAFDRIDTMNQFQKTVSIMTGDSNMANAALESLKDTTLGTAYGLDVASKATQGFLTRGMSLGAATNQVRIWADAVSFYGEGTNEQLQSVVDAIGKMYSKGKVEADQLDRLFDAGIGAAEIYAKAVGQTVSEVKENLSDGEISAAQFIQTVSDALDKGISAGAAKDAGATWATTFANMHAAITRGWTNIITDLDNELAARGLPSTMEMVTAFGQKVESVLNSVGDSMGFVVDCVMNVYDVMSSVGGFVVDNWSVISPIIYSVIAALGAYCVIMGIIKIIEVISAGVKIALALASFAHAAATRTEASATARATAEQYALNASLLSCPLTWIIIMIIALIAVIVALANHFSGAGHIAQSAFGAICGGVNVVIQFFKNLGLEVANIALGMGSAFCALGINIEVAFHNAICNVQSWFWDLCSTAMNVIEQICSGLNDLPFVEFDYSGITSAADDYAAKSAAAANNKRDYTSISDAFKNGMNTFDTFGDGWVDKAYKSGANWGDGITDKINSKIKNVFSDKKTKLPKTPSVDNYNDVLGSTAVNTGDTAKNTAKVADAVTATSEDLKYLRELAETDYINRFTTAQITVNQTNNNTINNEMDLDGVTEHLRSTMEEQMFAAAEGVH
ncbi:MAG: tape measure protein [Clostridiales bacterium]|nr:tape measure protein [Clostridiales bacterium]